MSRRIRRAVTFLAVLAVAWLAAHWLMELPELLRPLPLILGAFLAFRILHSPANLPGHRARHTRMRLRLRLHPGRGHASRLHLAMYWGRLAAFRESARIRPSLFWVDRLVHPALHSVYVGTAHLGAKLRLTVQQHVMVFAPPREGKSGWLSGVIANYPGAVLSTTTKPDIFSLTSGVRSRSGPVYLFNPQSIGDIPSNFRWSPITGCEDEATAIRMADAFTGAVSTKGTEGSDFWSSKASDYMRAYFCAAALGGGDLRDVNRWISGRDTWQAPAILMMNGRTEWAASLAQLAGPARKTAATILMVMGRALAFMADPRLQECVLPRPGEGFDIGHYLTNSGSLYLVAQSAGEESPLAALYACLTSEIHFQAGLIAAESPGQRLDPPVLFALDEVTQICPVPVPSWLADSGGKGIQLITVAHGVAQLEKRWGKDGARIIFDTSGLIAALPGVTDVSTLEMLAELAGRTAYKEKGNDGFKREFIVPPEVIRQLPPKRALLLCGSLAPVIARLAMGWKDPAVKAAVKARTARAILLPALPPLPSSLLRSPVRPEMATTGAPRVAPAPSRPELAEGELLPDREALEPGSDAPEDDGDDGQGPLHTPWRS